MNAPATSPASARSIRISGTVVAVSADGRFTLALPGGAERTGTASGQQLRRLGRFLGRDVLILGSESLDGTLSADGVLPAAGRLVLSVDEIPLSPSEEAELAARRGSIIGGWPGNETDEEIEAMLRSDR